MDVVDAAWTAAGASDALVGAGRPGVCARCGRFCEQSARIERIVSPTFTAFDSWRQPASQQLCAACAWAHREQDLRRRPYLISTTPTLEPLTPERLLDRLKSPVGSQEAITLPLRPGRKHLLTEASWGALRIDDATLEWTVADATRLEVVTQLLRRGVRPAHLSFPTPPWDVLSALPRQAAVEMMSLWSALSPWRHSPPWMTLAVHVTRTGAAR